MSETTEMLLFMLGGVFSCLAAGLAGYIALIREIGGVREYVSEVKTKVMILETSYDNLLAIMGKKGLKSLHSPDDHLGVDAIVDRYESSHFDLPFEDWQKILKAADIVLADPNEKDEEKKHYVRLGRLQAIHKLQCGGVAIVK